MNAIKLRVDVKEDHVIQLPPEVPVGPAEVIVIARAPENTSRRPVGIDAGKGFSVPDNFDDMEAHEHRLLKVLPNITVHPTR